MTEVMRIVLGSGSARRRMLLEAVGVDLVVDAADIDETVFHDETPECASVRLAEKKLSVIMRRHPGELCLCADTLVFLGETVLGKPTAPDDAGRMLRLLRGQQHGVVTGVCIGRDDDTQSFAVVTQVWFRELSDEEIDHYVSTGEPMDKAGAYGIQGGGGALTSRIEGSYSNVVGLPVEETIKTLREFDVDR